MFQYGMRDRHICLRRRALFHQKDVKHYSKNKIPLENENTSRKKGMHLDIKIISATKYPRILVKS